MLNFDLLKTLCETPGIPSREEPIREVVIEALTPLVDSVSVDVMGNVIGHKKGTGGPKVLIAAHMDEIGFMVKHIDDKGFIRLQPVGGFDPRNLVAQRVWVHGFAGESLLGALMPSSKPIHTASAEELARPPKLEGLFVDLGLPADEVKKKVEIGDQVTLARTCEQIGNHITSKTLDNRLSVFIMIEAIRAMSGHQCEIYAVATVQEEVGLRGATPAAYALEPDIAIALDVTLALDIPGGDAAEQITQLGKGTAIKIMDSSLLCHPKLVRHFRDVAEAQSIPYQLEILARGGTDAGGMQRVRGGIPSFTLSTPCRYVHTVNESAAVSDIEASIQLLSAWLEEAHTRTYGYNA
ncbi:M42 family metallopeptidase [Armatimonas rosea]|uniref:Endoglucanase n=1 Tax=Armatimonas rosea TaxID=685828 RepID=A0A7W9SQE3_ARMRO|nr:M42 family metallopeptidase [Armatimonas rosea]MBB6050069.1 endoglucanase [Armatimonas rosea]